MKHFLALALAFSTPAHATFAQGNVNSFSATTGVLTSYKVYGDWFFAEIRELDGTLSGCFASTTPEQGDFSFETADLNLLSFKEEGEVKRMVGINDFAVPGTPEMGMVKLLSDAKMEGQEMTGHVKIFFLSRPDTTGRYTISADISESGLENLKQGTSAGAMVSLERGPIYYSLRGSSAAIWRWEDCSDTL
jgi:hypothetical protein